MMKARLFVALAVVTIASAAPALAAITEPVKTENGQVSGVAGQLSDVRIFKGIPFAAPPVGDLRWKAPQPAKNWQGVRAADKFSANCMQRQAGGGAFPPYGGERSATEMSEDCLYLNVYTAAGSAGDKRPVMVWIHGGAYTSGAGAIYQGEDLAHKGVVVVTVNYRLGVFGFFAHPELTKESGSHASGNYAFLDQIAALKWVQKNIAAFGGDPSRVTIFGESAGSWSVNSLVATPLSKGLFQRAIGESGAQFTITRTLAEAEQSGTEFGKANGAETLAALRALPAEKLNAANGFRTSGTVDGWVFPQDVMTIFKNGKQNDVPVLIGSNANEGSIFTQATVTTTSFKQDNTRRYGADADAFFKLYPYSDDKSARAAQAAAMRDSTFGWEMRTWARLQTQTGKSKVFMYYFSHVPPLENSEWLGAQHGAEIPYAMNWPNGKYSTQVAWTPTDKKLAEQVSSYWVNFATSGDPNGKDLPKWAPYQTKDDQLMGFGDTPAMIAVPNKPALDFLDGYQQKARTAASPARSQSGRQ